MKTRKVLVAGLVFVQCGTAAYMTGRMAFPAMVSLLTLAGLPGLIRIHLSRERTLILFAACALALTAYWRLNPLRDTRYSTVLGGFAFLYLLVQVLLAFQVLYLFLDRFHRSEGNSAEDLWFPFGGAAVMILSASHIEGPRVHRGYLIWSLVFAVLFTAYCARLRRPQGHGMRRGLRAAIATVLLVVALVGGTATSLAVQGNEQTLNRWFESLVLDGGLSGGVGFQPRVRLGSMAEQKGKDADQVMIRVRSESEPGYLRATAYDVYNRGTWLDLGGEHEQKATAALPNGIVPASDAQRIFCIRSHFAGPWHYADVWPDSSLQGYTFLPLSASWLAAPVEKIALTASRTALMPNARPGVPYRYFFTDRPQAEALSGELRELYTRLPTDLDPMVAALAEGLFRDCDTSIEKLRRVEGFFHENFQYSLGIDPPAGVDPTVYFLEERPPAHCEYFASATALLLRASGVPARYVTGFVAVEYSALGGHWLARNQDAHAWVEAWVEGTGWVTVESTPSSGVPAHRDTPPARDTWEWMVHTAGNIVAWAKGVGRAVVAALAGDTGALLLHWKTWAVLGVILAFGAAIRWRVLWLPVRRRPVAPEIRAMHKLLKRMDRQTRRRGLRRPETETLHAFADRIAEAAPDDPWHCEAARWYRDYARLRFTRPVEPEAMEGLSCRVLKQTNRRTLSFL